MCRKFDDLVNNAKINQILNKNKADEERKNCLVWVLAIIGAVACMAAIAYAVYRHVTPRYLDDFDGDFDYDEFDDDFEDDEDSLDDDVDVYVKSSSK